MKAVPLLCLLVMLGWCAALPSPVYSEESHRLIKTTDKEYLKRQINVLRLYKSINQPCNCSDQLEIAKNFHIEEHASDFSNTQAYEQFTLLLKKGMLRRGEIFAVTNEVHLKEAIALFKMLFYAKDWETFYKMAVWARVNINEGVFVYALSVALCQRPDTYGIIIPPVYEIFPSSFFDSRVIEQLEQHKQSLVQNDDKISVHTEFSNYSGYYLNLNPEQSVSYFTEDIGLNAFYWQAHLFYPFWLGGSEFKLKNDRRGEQHYYLHQQLLARYYLERLSNNLGEIPFITYDQPIKTGYYPSLKYPNGLEFPARPNFAPLTTNERNYGQSWIWKTKTGHSHLLVKDYERRLRDAIDYGFVPSKAGKLIDLYTPEGIDILGNMMECNPDSPNTRFFGPMEIYARHLVGYGPEPLDKHRLAPSALEHFETCCRDPAFYQIFKRVTLLFQKYKAQMPPYNKKELSFPGVRIENVECSKMTTYFDIFDSDVTNAIHLTPEEFKKENVIVKIRQQRLNHKPFTYRIHLTSEAEQDASVRVFIGPKHDEYGRVINIQENRLNFVEIDNFKHSLKTGQNTIERNSRDFFFSIPDRTSYRDLYKMLMGALEGSTDVKIDASEAYFGFPNRLLLPKGTTSGQTFQLFVCLNPFRSASIHQQQTQQDTDYYFSRVGTGGNFIDTYAFGFPLDRIIDEYNFQVPNCVFHDVVITHNTLEDVNSSHYDRNTI